MRKLLRKRLRTRLWAPDDITVLRGVLRTITTPARRHKCGLCKLVFECHLCGIMEDTTHPLHDAKVPPSDVVCESCIEQHELWIRITKPCDQMRLDAPPATRAFNKAFGAQMKFYDHNTGEFIGRGAFRRR